MSFNQKNPRTPDQITDMKAVARRDKFIGGGPIAFVLAFLTGGPVGSFLFLGGCVSFLIATLINVIRTKKAEMAKYE